MLINNVIYILLVRNHKLHFSVLWVGLLIFSTDITGISGSLNLVHAWGGHWLFEAWLENAFFKEDWLGDAKVFLPVLSQYHLNRFCLSTELKQLRRLITAVEMFAKRHMINYFLLLHTYQTTSVNAR